MTKIVMTYTVQATATQVRRWEIAAIQEHTSVGSWLAEAADIYLAKAHRPEWMESTTRVELRAVAALLSHLEGLLVTVGEHEPPAWEDRRLARFAACQASEVGRLACRIERELAQWAGEAEGV
jgi:hypothetical protein